MKTTTAEKMILSTTGREVSIARASSWSGSKDACFRSGVNPSKKWAYSYYCPEMKMIYEPCAFYDTLAELIEENINR